MCLNVENVNEGDFFLPAELHHGSPYIPLLPPLAFLWNMDVFFPSNMLYRSLFVSVCLHNGKCWVNRMVMLHCCTLCINMYEIKSTGIRNSQVRRIQCSRQEKLGGF